MKAMKHLRRRSTQRRIAAIEKARTLLQEIADGTCDLLLKYRQVYGIYLDNSGAAEALRPLFRLPGISLDAISMSEDVHRTITMAVSQWLKENPT